jgi:hypothetical protein
VAVTVTFLSGKDAGKDKDSDLGKVVTDPLPSEMLSFMLS